MDQKTETTARYGLLVLVLTSSVLAAILTWGLPAMMSTFYLTPSLQITVPTNLAYVSVSNTGHGTAHNVRITVLARGDQRVLWSFFSSENATKEILYSEEDNVTQFTFQMKRMAIQASIVLNLKSYDEDSLRVWALSDENGNHGLARRGFGLGQPDLLGYITVSVTTAIEWFLFLMATAIIVALVASKRSRKQVAALLQKAYQR